MISRKPIMLAVGTYTSQMIKYLEGMKYNPLLNLKETVEEEMKFQYSHKKLNKRKISNQQ